MRTRRHFTALNGLVLGLLAAVTACTADDPGTRGLMVVTTTDMQIPKDVTHVGVQVLTASGETKLEHWYEIGEDPKQQLPGTIGIAPGKTDEPITIRVYSRQGGKVKSVTETVTTVPRDRTALLRMPIEWLSTGMVKSTTGDDTGADSGFPVTGDQAYFASTTTSCAKGKTARQGVCVSSEIAESSLPDYSPASVFGGGKGKGDGTCFDTVGCFESTTGLSIDSWNNCTASLDNGEDFDAESMSVALSVADGAGICGPKGCVVPLDLAGATESEPGYTVTGGKVKLPPAVCERLNAGTVRAVVASTRCASKVASVPVCGPWTSVGADKGVTPSASDRLAQCQVFVTSVCDNARRCSDSNEFYRKVWQNDGNCTERLSYLCDTSLMREEAAPWGEYFTGCGEAFAVDSCDQSLTAVRKSCIEPEGAKAEGDPCTFGQCEEGTVCLGAVPGGTGTCTARFALESPQQCGTGSVLDLLFPEGNCESGLLCEEGTACREVGAAAEPCVTDLSCEAGLACVSESCTAALGESDPCTDDEQCGLGLHCIGTAGVGKCRGPGEKGASCEVVTAEPKTKAWEENLCDLTAGLRCNSATWKCAKAVLVGQGDACTSLTSCAGGICGDKGVCVAYKADGSACKMSTECAPPAECLQEVCRLRPAFGVSPITMAVVPGEDTGCKSGLLSCDGTCTDVSADEKNCGACGTVCNVGATCENGRCVAPVTGVGGASSMGGTTSQGGTSSTGGTTTRGGSSATGGTTTYECAGALEGRDSDHNNLCVAKLVTVGETGTTFGIDATEVTRAQYAAWQATTTAATVSAQDATNCSWNTTFIPNAGCMAGTRVYQGTGYGTHPQVCVDWCDASAYCAGVGKRLCGKIGGGTNAYADDAKASASQWYNACVSGSAANTYPYGTTYNATACNGYDYWGGGNVTTTPVGSLPGCQASGQYAGVYDLSGNVREWEDSCDYTEQTAYCLVRGGYFNFDSEVLACDYDGDSARYNANDYVGFRCCAP